MSEENTVDVAALKTTYPSADLAYKIAVDSYDVLIKRLDAVDGRIQTLLAFAVSTSAIVPSIGGARGLPFSSPWFAAAAATMAVAVLLGAYARLGGAVRVLDPKPIREGWLHFDEYEFKIYMIGQAAEDFDENHRLLQRKWVLAVIITALFLLEAVALSVWVTAVARP